MQHLCRLVAVCGQSELGLQTELGMRVIEATVSVEVRIYGSAQRLHPGSGEARKALDGQLGAQRQLIARLVENSGEVRDVRGRKRGTNVGIQTSLVSRGGDLDVGVQLSRAQVRLEIHHHIEGP